MKGIPEIDKNTFRSIKKMNRAKMTEFCINIYFNAQEDLRQEMLEQSGNINLNELEKELVGIKGIGTKRISEIMDILKKYL